MFSTETLRFYDIIILYYCALYTVDRGRGIIIIIIQSWYSRHRSYGGGGVAEVNRAGGRAQSVGPELIPTRRS